MVRQTFDANLKQLKEMLLQMGGLVEKALEDAVTSLEQMNVELAQTIVNNDVKVNDYENEIEGLSINLIATQQPVAKDLRKIIAAIKIASALERMGDLSVDIAKVTVRLNGQPLIKPLVDIPRMAEIAKKMVSDGLNSYVDEDVEKARSLAEMDDQVDKLYKEIINELFALMSKDPSTINQASQLAFVGRYIERIGDHATNIGESVIYLVQGKKPDLNL